MYLCKYLGTYVGNWSYSHTAALAYQPQMWRYKTVQQWKLFFPGRGTNCCTTKPARAWGRQGWHCWPLQKLVWLRPKINPSLLLSDSKQRRRRLHTCLDVAATATATCNLGPFESPTPLALSPTRSQPINLFKSPLRGFPPSAHRLPSQLTSQPIITIQPDIF
jgi:hypothetical protein